MAGLRMVPLTAGAMMLAQAALAGDFGDGTRYVFVSAQHSARVAVIDSRDDRVAGSLDLGLEPVQVETAAEGTRLVAVDGRSARLAVVATAEGNAAGAVALDFAPSLLAVAGNSTRVVAAHPAQGRLAVVDVVAGRVLAATEMAPFRDMVAAGDRVVLAPRDGDGLAVLDLDLRPQAQVAPPRPDLGGFVALARAPNSRVVYARAAEPVVVAVDVRAARAEGEVASGASRAYTNAVGTTVMLPEAAEDGLALVPASLKGGAHLPGVAAVTGVYSGWFDTVSFLPSAASRSVAVVDQPGRSRGDDIVLGAVPGRGTVTPDGRKLYLPLVDTNRVAVIDAEQRRLTGYVALPHKPLAAVMARTFGLCH